MKQLLLFFQVLSIPLFVFAQPSIVDWENTFGANSDDEFHQVIEATNGYIVAVGETSVSKRGKDGLLVILDYSTGQEVTRQTYGYAKDDILRDVVQTDDGHFILGGSSNSFGKGKTDGWLLEVDEKGKVIWQQNYGTEGVDELTSLAYTKDGSVIAVGKRDERAIWLMKVQEKTPLWERAWTDKPQYVSVEGIAIGKKGEITLVGNTAKANGTDRDDIWTARIDEEGTLLSEKIFGEKGWESASDVIATDDGGFAIVGNTITKGNGKIDMWLLKLNAAGFKQWDRTYGGRDEDWAMSVAQTTDGGYLLTGKTLSHVRGAREYIARCLKVDKGGNLAWEKDYGGKKNDDAGNAILEVHDESIVFVGGTASQGSGGTDAWMVKFQKENPATRVGGKGTYNIEGTKLWLSTEDGFLKPNEQAYLSFDLTNKEDFDLPNIVVKLSNQSSIQQEVSFWENTYLGTMKAGETRSVKIPVQAGTVLETNDNALKISVLSEESTLANFDGLLKTKNPRPATLVVRDSDVTREGSTEYSPRTLTIEIENTGDFAASDVKVNFSIPPGVKALGSASAFVGEIPPHVTRIAKVRIQKTVQFAGTLAQVRCLIEDRNFNRTRENIEVSFDEIVQGKGDQFILFTQPNEARVNVKQLDWDLPAFPIEATFGTSSELRTESTTVLINGTPIDKGKMDEEDLSPPAKSGDLNYYAYENTLQLNEGLNKIVVQMRTPKGTIQSNEIIVNYVPRKPNLHVLAIGVPHKDLKYTSKDASDFANKFRAQAGEGKAYNRVFINELTSASETQFIPVRAAFANLKSRFDSEIKEDRITREDVLIVFISSHGKSENDEFKILTSEYEQFPTAALIDYKRDVLEILNQIDCKKFVFIDACHSGAAEGGKEGLTTSARRALEMINSTYPGLSVLTSSQVNQLSYEDDEWQNGAFTESILDAFENRNVLDSNGMYTADRNGDNIVAFGELYEFLKRRVPSLVQEKKNKAQMPSRTETDLGDDIPIFIRY